MSEIKCLVCEGVHFRKGYYDINVDIEMHSMAYNDVRVNSHRLSYNDVHIDIDVDVDTSIHNEIVETADISLHLKAEPNEKFKSYDCTAEVYKYICEDCGFIISFIKEKKVESKYEEKKRKQNENTYDWSGFGKNNC